MGSICIVPIYAMENAAGGLGGVGLHSSYNEGRPSLWTMVGDRFGANEGSQGAVGHADRIVAIICVDKHTSVAQAHNFLGQFLV